MNNGKRRIKPDKKKQNTKGRNEQGPRSKRERIKKDCRMKKESKQNKKIKHFKKGKSYSERTKQRDEERS